MEVPPSSLTTTSAGPSGVPAVVAVIFVEDTTVTAVAGLPIVTVAPGKNPVPLIVTGVPPTLAPDVGEIDVTVGGGGLT